MSLLDTLLNPDILSKVFSYLDGGSILRCSAVCKLWSRVVNDNILWRHKMAEEMGGDMNKNIQKIISMENQEIEKYRYLDPKHKTMPTSEFKKGLVKRLYLKKRRKDFIYRMNHPSKKIKRMQPVFPTRRMIRYDPCYGL